MHRSARALVAHCSRAIVLALLAPILVAPGVARAQTVPASVGNGDIVWSFANENPFFDSRTAGGLGTAMEPFLVAGAPAGKRVVRLEAQGPGLQPATIYPAGDVQKLLDASGYGNKPPFVVVGTCRTWSASAEAAAVVPLLDAALRKALGTLGVNVEPCTQTMNPAEAHILVWRQGIDTAPPLAQRSQPTFLGAPAQQAVPPFVPQQSGGTGGGPRPAFTGTGGPEVASTARGTSLVLLAALGAMMVLGGRRLTRPRTVRLTR